MQPTSTSVASFIDSVASPGRRRDAHTLVEMMTRITGEQPAMWGTSIIGFGSYHYKYASGREGTAGAAGFSPRKGATTVYLPDGVDAYTAQLSRLGDHTTGAGCLYIKDLAKVDLEILGGIIAESYRRVSADDFGSGG